MYRACINTSKFAKLCNTNKRTLIHYDEIGLFKPVYTDERGYRYYSESQCDIFFTITCLKDLGMPLKEIRTYIVNKNPEDLTQLLLAQQKKVQQELLHLKRIEQVINNKLDLVSEGWNIPFKNRCSEPYIEKFPPETMVTSPYLGTSRQEKLFHVLCEHIGFISHKHLNIGHSYGAMMRVTDLQNGITDNYAYFMTKVMDSSADISADYKIHKKPGGLYAVIYLQGDYYEADEAFVRLLDYIKEKNLIPGEFCYKEAVWDELTVEDKKEYITRISIPVK